MTRCGNGLAALALALGLISSSCSTAPPAPPPAGAGTTATAPGGILSGREPASSLTADQQILHVLNRLGYGPRPGDLDLVTRMGLAAYVERQLDPRSIPDTAAEHAVASYRTLAMTTPALVREYPRPTAEAKRKRAHGEMSAREMMESFPPGRRPTQVLAEVQAAKVARAVLSARQ